MSFRLSRLLSAAVTAGACVLSAGPASAAPLPDILMAPQGTEYMCGGVGREQQAFMEMVSPRWGATLEFAVSRGQRGQFDEPVKVRVVNKYNGEQVLDAVAHGPYMLARLAPGTYDVEATLGPLTLTQTLNVALGAPGRTLFLWPSNFDIAAATHPPQALAQGPQADH
ncbi:hypothetical protein [uncultured Pseudacidovorax sp.]|uniref:hypothetical protein n=1 Tax=uncultured Pseudacidovorax sp. TaxID=679313 RepID=UPI0025CF864E|nr:hypothetical protein [uncultured Pseudacidovorax sp.]